MRDMGRGVHALGNTYVVFKELVFLAMREKFALLSLQLLNLVEKLVFLSL
jgi:hypothetical protein